MLFLLVFGLPSLVHTDDPTRAVLACFDMVKVFKRLHLVGKFGVTTGRNYCGVCGSARRMEYTVLGDSVNLSARLMSNAPPLGIYCDDKTKLRSTTEIIFNALAPIKVKGKANPIPIFQPVKKEINTAIGLTSTGKISFPWHQNAFGGVSAGGLSVGEFQEGVVRLCTIKSWQGIAKASELLCGGFRKEMHQDQVLQMPAAGQPPKEGPFRDGGVMVIEGPTGIGKIEVAEHCVTHAAVTFRTFPVFGTMGPRPGDSVRLGCELLRSTIGIFRWASQSAGNNPGNPALPADDFEALKQLVPKKISGRLPLLQQVLVKDKADLSKERSKELLEVSLTVVIELLSQFAEKESVVMVLQFEYGTSLFPKNSEDQSIFWETVATLYEQFIEKPTSTSKPRVMMLVCRGSNSKNPAVAHAAKNCTLLSMQGLDEANISEYMSSYLNLPDSDTNLIPSPLRFFVSQVTLGNPLYIRETIDQLREHHIQVNQGAGGQIRNVECKDIDKVNVSHWGHTAMVGNTVCLLEALDPLEAAVLKMSTCFAGPFTLGDLAASTCSRWADSTYFDFLRLFQAIRKLVESEIIDAVAPPQDDLRAEAAAQSTSARKLQYFQTQNVLIRSVGGAMVLEAQKKSVKRQALIDRALSRELPAKMAILAIKRSAQHIPWYYEQAFRRML